MKKESTDLEIGKEVRPTLNRILVELIKESDEYFSGLKKTDNNIEIEPYVLVHGVGTNVKDITPGDYVFVRPNLVFDAFRIGTKQYSLINEHDVTAVLSPMVKELMTQERISQAGKKKLIKIDDIN